MSYQTEADDNIEITQEHIKGALKALNKIVVLECQGHDSYNEDYYAKLQEAHVKLIELRNLLKD